MGGFAANVRGRREPQDDQGYTILWPPQPGLAGQEPEQPRGEDTDGYITIFDSGSGLAS